MVSFRFFIVSITAVFLALAVGITMGATVVDKATVDLLHNQINATRARANASDQQYSALKSDSDAARARADGFDTAGATTFVDGRLSGLPVLVIGMRGAEQGVDDVRKLLQDAGATVEGTVWFTKGMRLDKSDATVGNLAGALGLNSNLSPDDIRHASLVKLAQSLASASARESAPAKDSSVPGQTALAAMKTMGLVDFDPADVKDVNFLPLPHTRFVIISAAQPDVPNEQVAAPFTNELAKAAVNQVVAAESGTDASAQANRPAVREVFLAPLRADAGLKGKMSTVDNIEDVRGRVALVYAIRDLPTQLGNYGVGPHASDGPLPKS